MKTTTVLALALASATAFSAPVWADEASADVPADTAAAEVAATTPDAPAGTIADENLTDNTAGKLKVQSIRVEDRYGTIEEERVPAMRSEVRYVPAGSTDGYNLIGAQSAQGKTQNVHRNTNELMIPSWKLFNW